MPTGSGLIDFGPTASPQHTTALVVTGQTNILAASKVAAWIRPDATTDHSADEHLVEPLRVQAGSVVASTGFTVYVEANPQTYGTWNIDWVWI